jgi:hydroxylamine reductase
MFCFQCEQTKDGQGCTKFGVCGKSPEVAEMQDQLVLDLKQIAKAMPRDKNLDGFIVDGLFSTVTNVNFDPDRFHKLLDKARDIKKRSGISDFPTVEILQRRKLMGDDVIGLQEMLTYGLKGTAAYAHHAKILGQEDDSVYAFFHEALSFLASNPMDAGKLLAMCLRCGEVNLKVMGLLDKGHTMHFGNPVPTKVRITPVKGKAILISGHDMKDLEDLLRQTEGKGINIYTHGEMLPAHGYPELKKYKHLVGNYGGAWQDQQKEFAAFPGAILMTTNCIQRPQDNYKARIFTNGLVGWPEVVHIKDNNFAPVIEAALKEKGFESAGEEKYITVGFAHSAVLGVAPAVVEAVRSGKIRRFFLIGGCDGAKSGRNYYTEFAEKVPSDCVILTLACGKYRFNKLDFGDIGGIPRLLDMGQCNDAYSAIKVAGALAGAFNCGVNDLPLSLILSWYEQKAVCILLTLLSLGIKNMRLGPSLPAFVTPAMLKILAEKFNIMPITTADADLKAILG